MSSIDSRFWFEIARGMRPLDDIPEDISARVLARLNDATAATIVQDVPLLGEEDRAVSLAQQVVDVRERDGGFVTLSQLWNVPGVGPARFVEIVRSIADTDDVTPTDLGQKAGQPSGPLFSASETELHFSYEILGKETIRGEALARYCTACSASAASYNKQLETWEAQVRITGLILDGENDQLKYSIQMDLRMMPYDWMQPIPSPQQSALGTAAGFHFPAKMQLNNSMIIDAEIKKTGQRLTLVSRDVPCQVGRVTNWPPYNMMLHTQDQVVYYNQADPLGPPIMRILDGTTYLLGPECFFGIRTDIKQYQYIAAQGERGLPAVVLEWEPRFEPANRIHHYVVYRSPNPDLGEGSWVNVSGPIIGGKWIDPNPPCGLLYYRVIPVMRDIFGKDYSGFPGQVRRVEPASSMFRY